MGSDGALVGLDGGVCVVVPWCFHGAFVIFHTAFTVLSLVSMNVPCHFHQASMVL